MLSLLNNSICVLISSKQHNHDSSALDFILAASNLTENITVIFLEEGNHQIHHFLKPLEGFDITKLFTDNKNHQCHFIKFLSKKEILNHVTHCEHLFCF